ncbi:MAG: glycosyltransferase family 4 protein [Nitrospirae bacterium]|nr:glycosyltransferase family 4 protein [Nitrospirota bacterium]
MMIRVAFLDLSTKNWMGGLNYLWNLLYAVSEIKDKKIEPVLFIGKNTDSRLANRFKPYAEIISTKLFDRGSIYWFIYKTTYRLTGSLFLISRLLKKHDIHVVSHSAIAGRHIPYKNINWIPDFQHVHLPYMFHKKELKARNKNFMRMGRFSDVIILSSYNSLNDYNNFLPDYADKAKVMHFVSKPDPAVYEMAVTTEIELRYDFKGKFFYLPNQFWKHKNHKVLFDAVNLLKKRGKDILVLCSGPMDDYRNSEHIEYLKNYIAEHGLEKNIKLLGVIDYKDVLCLMRNCISIINPSLFEGWSSTVEEAKSIGKNLILSNIEVHREQNPPNSIYFDPGSALEMAEILIRKWENSQGGPDSELEENAKRHMENRFHEFGLEYQNIVFECISRSEKSLHRISCNHKK